MPFPVTYRFRTLFRIRNAIIALGIAIIFGTLGFRLIEGWSFVDSFYVTVQTLTTVGYGDLPPRSLAGRGFAVVVMQTKGLYEDKRTTINSEAFYDHTARKAIWKQTEKDKKPDAKTLSFSDPVHDVLTLIYFVRAQNLKPGQSFEVTMVDAGHTYRCVVNVVPGKKMNTAVGRVNTVTVEPAIFDGEREVRPRGALVISMTDDARHLPVKAQVKSNIGTIDIKLKRVIYRDADIAQK